MADILLLEPGYSNKYPPIGLMKISYFHKYIHHDYVRFAKGELPEAFREKKWDRVYVTTLFTFEWERTKKALEYALTVVKDPHQVYTGGILATLMPELIAKNFPTVKNNTGLLNRTMDENVKDISTLPLILTVEDLTKVFTIGKNTAYKLIRSGAIYSVRVGRNYRIPRDAITEFLQTK